jgi:hypothetical protein
MWFVPAADDVGRGRDVAKSQRVNSGHRMTGLNAPAHISCSDQNLGRFCLGIGGFLLVKARCLLPLASHTLAEKSQEPPPDHLFDLREHSCSRITNRV